MIVINLFGLGYSAFLMTVAGTNVVTYIVAGYLLDEFANDLRRTDNWENSFNRNMFFGAVPPTELQTAAPIDPEPKSELDGSPYNPAA